jgi:multimeric flavodoxin WrbA
LDISLTFSAVSGSRRHGNTLYLLDRAMSAVRKYVDEFNAISKGVIHVSAGCSVTESGFDKPETVKGAMMDAHALLLGSPVYFGSIAPSLNEVMQQLSPFDLSSKVGACVTVGTQRNGGQETAIEDIWRWFMAKSITFVGNGPVTSQYGGTAWGGAIGTAEKDEYGLHTTEGTGKRLAQDAIIREVGRIVVAGGYPARKPRFLVFHAGPRPNLGSDGIGHHTKYLSLEEDMTNVEDCVACAVCPPDNVKEPGVYGCIFDDDVNRNYHYFYDASTIVCSASDDTGLCPPGFWRVLNRMRSVRRNNYDLTGRCGAVMGTSLIPLKWLVRNNLPIVPSRPDLLFRETVFRSAGLEYLQGAEINPWTEPTQHE